MRVRAISLYFPLIFNKEYWAKVRETTRIIERVSSGEAFQRTTGKPTHKYNN